MTRKEIQELHLHQGFPAITVVMHCDRQQVADTLMRLLHEAQLNGNREQLQAQCLRAIDTLACPLKTHKIALFIDKHGFYSFVVPAAVPDIAVCQARFRLDTITQIFNHQQRYWVIDCTTETPVLAAGIGELITPVQVFTRCHFTPTNNTKGTQPTCFETQACRYFEQERLPICLLGPAACLDRFPKLSIFDQDVIARMQQQDEIWPTIQRWYAAEIERAIKRVAEGVADKDYLTDFHAMLSEARQGFVTQLVVQANYQRAGWEHPITRAVVLSSTCPPGYEPVAAIDELIETVLAKGGTILIVPAGSLPAQIHAAAFIAAA